MSGLSQAGFGSTPFGVGTPVAATVRPDPPTAARFIKLPERDYQRGTDGEFKRMPVTRQRVLLSVGTRNGSSTVLPELGTEVPDVIDDSTQQKVKDSVLEATRLLVADGSITVDDVTVETNVVGRLVPTISYTDTSTSEDDTLSI